LSAHRPGLPRPAVLAALGLALGAALWAAASLPAQQSTTGGQAAPASKSKPAGSTTAQGAGGSGAAAGGGQRQQGQSGNQSQQNNQSQSGNQSQQGQQGQGGKAGAGSAGAAGPTLGAPTPDMGSIDQILEGDEEVLSGNSGFTYDPGNRRDPFKSLLIAPDRPEFRGPRPEGVPGLLIDEVDLKGIYRTARGFIAQVTASNQKKSFLLKEGDQLYDGDVVSIGKNEVVFKQIVQDPTALKPFREIAKSLTPPH
jgi:hypothetical protein